MFQIRPMTANFQKKSPVAGSSVYFPQLNGFDHVATLLGKCSKSDRTSQILKNSPAAGSSIHLPQNEIGLTMLLHYWESAPNPTEDRKSSKKFACGGQSVYFFRN
jgi:hypothetical protein